MPVKNSITHNRPIVQMLADIILYGWPENKCVTEVVSEDELWQTGLAHGVLPLCSYSLRKKQMCESFVSSGYQKQIQNFERQAVVTEILNHEEILDVLKKLAEHGIHPLLLKGTPLAYTLYIEPYLRPRCDTDFLFSDFKHAERAWHVVESMGYKRPVAVTGEFVTSEFSCCRKDRSGGSHCLDFHWRINNNAVFSRAFFYDALVKSSSPVPLLNNTRTLSHVHSFLFACVHRLSHKLEGTSEKLIWLYDIYLLTRTFSTEDWQWCLEYSKEKQLCTVVVDGLLSADVYFPLQQNRKRIAGFASWAQQENLSLSVWRSRGRSDLAHFQALPSIKDRLQYIRESLFPPAPYMYAKYGFTKKKSRILLVYFYMVRMLRAIPKFLR